MKVLALLLTISLAPACLAKPRDWKIATVENITTEDRGAAAVPIAGLLIAVPITHTFYWIKANGLIYVLSCDHPLNLTIHGQTKIAVDEHGHSHLMDDSGKDRKVHIVRKIAEN